MVLRGLDLGWYMCSVLWMEYGLRPFLPPSPYAWTDTGAGCCRSTIDETRSVPYRELITCFLFSSHLFSAGLHWFFRSVQDALVCCISHLGTFLPLTMIGGPKVCQVRLVQVSASMSVHAGGRGYESGYGCETRKQKLKKKNPQKITENGSSCQASGPT